MRLGGSDHILLSIRGFAVYLWFALKLFLMATVGMWIYGWSMLKASSARQDIFRGDEIGQLSSSPCCVGVPYGEVLCHNNARAASLPVLYLDSWF